MFKERLLNCIKNHRDFPKSGIIFRDLLSIAEHPELFQDLINRFCALEIIMEADAIVAIDARGFIFGAPIALNSKKPLIFARKPGKLPGELISNSYSLEYGENSLAIQKDAIEKYDSYAIVDDLLATGGTAASVEQMLISQGKIVSGLCVIIELLSLKGRDNLNCSVHSEISFD